jgi:predicted DNA-binding protein
MRRTTLERTDIGTFKPKYDEKMKNYGVRVPKSIADKLDKLPNKTQFLREIIIKAVEELDLDDK